MKRALAALIVVAVGCAPTLTSTDSLVSAPRILAVRAEPAEAMPGATVMFQALLGAPPGVSAGSPAWSFCVAPKPLTEDNVVSDACLGTQALRPASRGLAVTASTPSNGCSLFGPDVSTVGQRLRDPDATGGYYQPLRLDLGASEPTFALVRISCDLANASAASATAFARAYVPNQNPQLLPLAASVGGVPVSFDAIATEARVDLRATWPPSSAETYAHYDVASDTVGTKRESLTLAWYSSSGVLDQEATGRAEDDTTTSSDNTWTAPATGETASLWVVLRDSRGGVDFAEYAATVSGGGGIRTHGTVASSPVFKSFRTSRPARPR